MTTRPPHFVSPPPPEPDEGYWAALLNEGEYAQSSAPEPPPLTHDDHHSAWSSSAGHAPRYAPGDESQPADWAAMRAVQQRDETIDLPVISSNRGGLVVEWRTLRGFVPASQLVDFSTPLDPQARQAALNSRMGRTLTLRVIELDELTNRLILSERAARVQAGRRADILTRLRPGDTIRGVVTNLTDFGAFLDLGGLEGLVHISELSWGRVGHPADLLVRGATVEASVLEVNPGAGRVALSIKRLHPDPWATVHLRYAIGDMVTGTITNVVDFGAFARIEEGLEGLIHVSELAEGHFLHPRNVVSEGQEITARVLAVDGRARRLSLTLRSAAG